MIRVVVELVPNGDEAAARVLRRIQVGNVTGFGSYADYRVDAEREGRRVPSFTVFDHCRDEGVDALLARTFTKLMGVPE